MAQMTTEERLVYMANQIALNFAISGEARAALATADHISAFWAPAMTQRLFARAEAGDSGLSPIAQAAVTRLQERGAPPSQTGATEFGDARGGGQSDAG